MHVLNTPKVSSITNPLQLSSTPLSDITNGVFYIHYFIFQSNKLNVEIINSILTTLFMLLLAVHTNGYSIETNNNHSMFSSPSFVTPAHHTAASYSKNTGFPLSDVTNCKFHRFIKYKLRGDIRLYL